MNQTIKENIILNSEIQARHLETGLSFAAAKLYSQYTRLRSGQEGLPSWTDQEAQDSLQDAIILLEIALELKEDEKAESWQPAMLRSAEILEWLSHPGINVQQLPLTLMAAAAYQLAGYPARALGLLKSDSQDNAESTILRSMLKADFPSLFKAITEYWSQYAHFQEGVSDTCRVEDEQFQKHFQYWIVQETIRALGLLCASMRWEKVSRVEQALTNLNKVAGLMAHGGNLYSWLLSLLCHLVVADYLDVSMREQLRTIFGELLPPGPIVLERYLRQNYQRCRALAWPSQITGIQRLITGESFALCTPTGSGKTTIAELAIIQGLFSKLPPNDNSLTSGDITAPLALYLVPTRALAAEVESKFDRVLRRKDTPVILVTGLYGGTDWGPTDFWLTSNERTVLICTYEKAEALLRFLGPLFMHRVSLIIIDEAHTIQFNGDSLQLLNSESRSLRLESLITRLFSHLQEKQSRVIALSAVAAGLEEPLAEWVAGNREAEPVRPKYRSTRQLIGCLECLEGQRFRIRYDLLDGADLQFKQGRFTDKPYVPQPFPPYPQAKEFVRTGPEKSLRPYLFWAAMNMAQEEQRTVLISITQGIEGYAQDFLDLLKGSWADESLPDFFTLPTDEDKLSLWEKCLDACEDYFSKDSFEYRLLTKGVVVHHGKMPGLMARLLVEIIHQRIARLVLATSTLSEGVNLPFEVVLIPTLRRLDGHLSVQEFANLVGRAGRPGVSTEGQSLVLLDYRKPPKNNRQFAWSVQNAKDHYVELIDGLKAHSNSQVEQEAQSPLAALLKEIETLWQEHFGEGKVEEFLGWLEKTAPLTPDSSPETVIKALDSLDNILLSSIAEVELIAGQEIGLVELEGKLKDIWKRSFAYYASGEQARLQEFFIKRGKGLRQNVYKDQVIRRRLYRTSLPPRDGNALLNLYSDLREYLEPGTEYADWDAEQKFSYIRVVVEKFGQLERFELGTPPRNTTWDGVLHWWLLPQKTGFPQAAEISNWYNYASKYFQYRFNWGLGSFIALAIDEIHKDKLRETTLSDWQEVGLPWVVFWIKELMIWGTLDPVAAYLLSSGLAVTRKRAEETARAYYDKFQYLPPNERLDAATIREWGKEISEFSKREYEEGPPQVMAVKLLRNFSEVENKDWKVMPVEIRNEIYWFDPAGFELAVCLKPPNWAQRYMTTYDFTLNSSTEMVFSHPYI